MSAASLFACKLIQSPPLHRKPPLGARLPQNETNPGLLVSVLVSTTPLQFDLVSDLYIPTSSPHARVPHRAILVSVLVSTTPLQFDLVSDLYIPTSSPHACVPYRALRPQHIVYSPSRFSHQTTPPRQDHVRFDSDTQAPALQSRLPRLDCHMDFTHFTACSKRCCIFIIRSGLFWCWFDGL